MDTQQHYFRVTKPSEEASFGPRIEEYWTIVETKKKATDLNSYSTTWMTPDL